MYEHKGRVKGVMLGVGAAFDFHAGISPSYFPYFSFFFIIYSPIKINGPSKSAK